MIEIEKTSEDLKELERRYNFDERDEVQFLLYHRHKLIEHHSTDSKE